jgi:hypothetical protein
MANASPDRLAHLIKVCGFLTQTKVYLFEEEKWRNREFVVVI